MDICGFEIESENVLLVLKNGVRYPMDTKLAERIPLISAMIELDDTTMGSEVVLPEVDVSVIEFIAGYFELYGDESDEYYISCPLYKYDIPTDYLTKMDADYFKCLNIEDKNKYICDMIKVVKQINYLGCDMLTHKLCALISALKKI